MRHAAALAIALAALPASTALVAAAEREIAFDTQMSCPMSDPPVYERAMTGIVGVSEAVASFADQTLVVRYDDDLTGPEAMIDALDAFGVSIVPRPPED